MGGRRLPGVFQGRRVSGNDFAGAEQGAAGVA